MHDVLYYALKGRVRIMRSVYILMHQRKPDTGVLARRVLEALREAHIAASAETGRFCAPTRWPSDPACTFWESMWDAWAF